MNAHLVVVPTDFSRHSLEALETAVQAVSPHGRLHVLHVIDDLDLVATGVDPAVSARLTQGLIDDARRQFARLTPRLGHVPHHFTIRFGTPTQAILDYVDECGADLLVMATHGRQGFARAFLGSTTEALVRRARCPVLTVHPAEQPPAAGAPASAAGKP